MLVDSFQSDKERLLHQFHFTQWPDHGTPNPSQLVHFNSRVEQHQNDESGTLLVHCRYV
jgi:protein tyrosine phosphatase